LNVRLSEPASKALVLLSRLREGEAPAEPSYLGSAGASPSRPTARQCGTAWLELVG